MKKRGFLIYLFILGFVFIPKMVFAETITGTATIGRQSILDQSNIYYYTDWKSLSTNSLNSIPVGSIYSGDSFYLMGSEYSYAISLTGQTNFAITVRVPVSANTIYSYTETDSLNQNDFRVGISPNFGVYNITPTITSFNRAKGVYARNGVAHVYMYYDIVFNFTLTEPLTGAYNLNFSVMNLTANRSAYFLSGGNSGVALEFPVGYFSGQSEPDAVLFSMMSPTVSMSYGTSSDNQDIIDANNENTQLIISNNNENTQDIIDSIDENYEKLVDSQEVCNVNILTSSSINGKNIYFNGKTNYNQSFLSSGSYTVSCSNCNNSVRYFYRESGSSNITVNNGDSFTISSSGSFWLWSNDGFSSVPDIKLLGCKNGNQAINDKLDGLLDQSTDGIDFTFGDIDVISDTPVSDLLLLPFELITKISTSIGSGCMTWDLPFNLWGNDNFVLHIPCINIEAYIGSTVWTVIDDMFCIFMIYNIFKMLLRFFESWSSLNDTFDSVVGGVK